MSEQLEVRHEQADPLAMPSFGQPWWLNTHPSSNISGR